MNLALNQLPNHALIISAQSMLGVASAKEDLKNEKNIYSNSHLNSVLK